MLGATHVSNPEILKKFIPFHYGVSFFRYAPDKPDTWLQFGEDYEDEIDDLKEEIAKAKKMKDAKKQHRQLATLYLDTEKTAVDEAMKERGAFRLYSEASQAQITSLPFPK